MTASPIAPSGNESWGRPVIQRGGGGTRFLEISEQLCGEMVSTTRQKPKLLKKEYRLGRITAIEVNSAVRSWERYPARKFQTICVFF